jgi:hypothetical protein
MPCRKVAALGALIVTAAVTLAAQGQPSGAAGGRGRAAGPAGTATSKPCPNEPAAFHACALERAKTFQPPRTPDGKPDLQGYWRGLASATENIEEHPMTDDDNGGKSLVVDPADGKIPYLPAMAARVRTNRDQYVEPNVPCFPSGIPRSHYVPTQTQIQQTRDYVLILFERAHTYRIIPTGGRPHIGGAVHLWMGDSRGRWEGNTLVVDVRNQNAKAWFDQAGNVYSDGARMVERFTLVDPDTIHYQVRIDDPTVFTRPWTLAAPIRRNRERGFRLIEEACHEGERNTQPLVDAGQKIYPGIKAAAAAEER